MHSHRTVSSILYAVATLALVAAAPACSSAEAPDDTGASENAITEGNLTFNTTSFTGEFRIPADPEDTMEFSVTHINWSLRTARWNAKRVTRDGTPIVVVDVDVPMSIDVRNGFVFSASKGRSALVRIDFNYNEDEWAAQRRGEYPKAVITAMTYTIHNAINPKFTPSEAPTLPTGTCSLECRNVTIHCQDGMTQEECSDTGPTTRPTDPCEAGAQRRFRFRADATCVRGGF